MVARKWVGAELTTVIAIAVLALFLFPATAPGTQAGPTSVRASAPGPGARVAGPAGLAPLASAAPHPQAPLTFPRTVLVETFTGVWCPHCPAEAAALFGIDQATSHNVLDIAELHSCAGAPPYPCYDNYVAPDGTQTARANFYGVTGYPTVFFDGEYPAVGATNSAPQMASDYNARIANATAIPGNVSIADSAWIGNHTIGGQVTVTSGLTGSYNEVSYLLEYIDKLNVSSTGTPHDIAWVVRETLHNHPVSLAAGSTDQINFTAPLNASWNVQNLSVISFVQDNSTKIIENANFALVSNLLASVTSGADHLDGGNQTTITVHVTDGSTGSPVAGAAVTLSASAGGTFSPASGATLPDGSFTTRYTSLRQTALTTDLVTVNVTGSNSTPTSSILLLLLNPVFAPSAPSGLTLTPGAGQVLLSWTPPASGAFGVNYLVEQGTGLAGPYTVLANTTSTAFTATGLSAGQTLWFHVVAQNNIGLSPASGAAEANSVAVTPSGLPSSSGWWITVGSQNFTSSSSSGGQVLFYPPGPYSYTFGTLDAAYEPTISQAVGTFDAGTGPITVSLAFTERLGTLKGTVYPISATVLLNGLPVEVTQGSFSVADKAGTYYLNASSSGYKTNSTRVTLAPGSVTNINVQLAAAPSGSTGGGSSSALGGLGGSTFWIGIGLVVVVVAAVLAMVAMRSRGRVKGPGQ